MGLFITTGGNWNGPDRRRDKRAADHWNGLERRKDRLHLVEGLEGRVHLSSQDNLLAARLDYNDTTNTNADAISMTLLAQAQAGSTKLPLTSVPTLSSDPGAACTIYLNFVGAPAMTWGQYNVPATPAYDQDGDATTFTSAELTSITEIWQAISEMYSPFNINVTTVPLTSLVHGQNMEMIFGGSGTWLGAAAGGVSYIGGYASTSLPNISFVFPGELANGTPKYTAEAAAHEAGHEFGLFHQAVWSGTTLEQDYNPGNGVIGPIMGDPYGDTRGLWFDGVNDESSTTIQDDMAVISDATNGFGYRNDGISHALASPTALASGSSLSSSGIISTTSQVDYYEFTTGAGTISLTTSQFSIPAASYDGMLSLKFSLYNSADQLITSSASGLSETMNTTVAAGTYIVAISSDGSYGDVGQYNFSGTIIQPPPTTPSSLNATAAGTTSVNLSWTDTAGDETGFYIYRSPDDSTWTQVGSTTSTTFQDTGLNSATLYYYRICAYNAAGSSGYTSVASATTQTAIPAAPTSLLASAASTSSIALSWTDNASNETGYYVERSPDDSTWTQIASLSANVTTYTDSSLASATTYYYRVRAYNAGGDSAYTNVASATTQTPPPGVPTAFTATAVSTTEIDLAWSDNSNQLGFYIERSPDDSTWTQIASTTSTSYQNTGLTSSTTYYYRIRAYNAGGDSGYANAVSATTLTPIPTAPTTLVATAAGTTQINLSWTDNSTNESGFYIERSPNNTNWTQITSVPANTTSYSDTNLSSSTLYYYRVRAYNTGGDSAYTNVSSATTLTPVPTVPNSFVATVASSTEIDLSWSDNSNQTGFYIERSLNDSTWTQIASTSSTTYADTALSSSTLYYYRIRAYNAGGDSAYAGPISATTLVTPPTAPNSLVATSVNTAEIDLSWTNTASNASGIYIERSPDNATWSQIASVSSTTTTYDDTGLTVGATFFYRIRAYNDGGDSSYSATASAVAYPLIAPPMPAQSVAASSSAFDQVSLSWVPAMGDTGFYVQRSTDRQTWNTIAQLPQSATTYTDTSADSSTHYFYRVIAFNAAGDAPASNLASATTPNYSVILDNASASDVTITGRWSQATSPAGYFGSNFLQDNNLNKGQDSVTFSPTIPEDGSYEVFMRWTSAPNRASNVPVTITYAGGSITLTINQRIHGSQWVQLGTFNFSASSPASVAISNANTNGVVVADAVQFIKIADTAAAPYRLTPNVTIAAAAPTFAANTDLAPLSLQTPADDN